jgi:hypothetical protein
MVTGRLTGELAIALASNIAAAGIIWLSTRSITAALAAAMFVMTCLAIYLILRPAVASTRLGIQRTWKQATDGPVPREILAQARNEFAFWGISAKSMLSDEDFRQVLLRVGRSGCEFRFLFLDPDSLHLSTKAAEEGDTAEGWRQEIRANVARVQRLCDEHGVRIQVRYYDEYPVFRVFFVDDLAYFGWYPPDGQGIKSPFARIAGSRTSLHYPLRLAFENHWRLGADCIVPKDKLP